MHRAGALLFIFLGACSSDAFTAFDKGGWGSPHAIVLSEDEVVLTAIGATAAITAVVVDWEGEAIPDARVVWSSSDPRVAGVSSSGVVTAIGEGRAELFATFGDLRVAARAWVAPIPKGVAGLAISPGELALTWIGQTLEMRAVALDADSNEISQVLADWSSSDPSVARVDESGILEAVRNGEATVVASLPDGSLSAWARVRVKQAPATLRFLRQPTDATAGVPMEQDVVVEVLDAGGRRVSEEDLVVALTCLYQREARIPCGSAVSHVGMATFRGLAVERAGQDVVLEASVGKAEPGTSEPFHVVPAPAEKLAFLEPLRSVEALVPFAAKVAVVDAFGNPTGEEGVHVALTLQGDGILVERTSVTESGVAVFTDLLVDEPMGFTLHARTPSSYAEAGPSLFRASYVFVEMALGSNHGCGLLRSGSALCFGSNEAGQLGDHADPSSDVPLLLPLGPLTALRAGFDTTCGVEAGGGLFCWGPDPRAIPPPAEARVHEVAVGFDHACFLDEGGQAYCWGANDWGQLGDGTALEATEPVQVDGPAFAGLAAGRWFTCGVTPDGKVWCWGNNQLGQLGTSGPVDSSPFPTEVPALAVQRIVAGDTHVCVLDSTGSLQCWGAGAKGQLGHGDSPPRSGPVKVASQEEAGFSAVASGEGHSCALTEDGRAYCWGACDEGRLGQPAQPCSSGSWPLPVPVDFPEGETSYRSVHAGGRHSCALGASGTAWCWGEGDRGQLGNGLRLPQPSPTAVKGTER